MAGPEDEQDLPDFQQIAEDTIEEHGARIMQPGVLAHELALAWESGSEAGRAAESARSSKPGYTPRG